MKTRVVLFIMALCVAFTPAYSALRNHTWKANGTLSDSEKPQHPGRIASAIHYNVYDKYAVRQNRQKLSASADYIPMVAPGKVWRYNMKDYCYDPYDDRLCDILIGDSTTIIDGDEFYPLYICFDGERPNESTAPWGYARDNAAELRVEFRYNPTSENDETTRFLNLFLPKKYLYDFVNPDNEDAIFTALHPILEISDIGTGMTSEGKVYPGFVYDGDAYVQGLGYV